MYKVKWLAMLLVLVMVSCEKEETLINNSTNKIPVYSEIPTNIVENYVNRVFIDLINREPTDEELENHVIDLRNADLAISAREDLIELLMTDSTFREGDISYKYLYHHWFYEKVKTRVLESAPDSEIQHEIGLIEQSILRDTLNGDSSQVPFKLSKLQKLQNVLDSDTLYYQDKIDFKEMFKYMVDNSVFDFLNMNTFNFINACFDYYFYRFPTEAEFNASFEIIEYNSASTILNAPASNKEEYIDALVNSREFNNGMVTWAYEKLTLKRPPTSLEMSGGILTLHYTNDFDKLLKDIMKSDEYAQFTPLYK